MEPLISVIVPVYNVEPYLRKCVDSILNQTYRNLEVILVDDGSPDSCGAICNEYAEADPRVHVIHKSNGGQATARNTGLEAYRGDYVTFVDSDDWLSPNLYSSIMAQLPFDIAVFGCTFVAENGAEKSTQKASQIPQTIDPKHTASEVKNLLDSSLFGYAWNKICRREVIGSLRFEQIPLREDLAFYLEAFKKANRVFLSDEAGYFYLQRENSTLHNVYSGEVPNLKNIVYSSESIFFGVSNLTDSNCASQITKTYLTDFSIKYIVQNTGLSPTEALCAINTLFSSKLLKKEFRFNFKEGRMFCFFTLCYKLRLGRLFYQVMKGITHE